MSTDRLMAAALAESKALRAKRLADLELRAAEQAAAGKSVREIAARLGESEGRVAAALKRANVTPRRPERWEGL